MLFSILNPIITQNSYGVFRKGEPYVIAADVSLNPARRREDYLVYGSRLELEGQSSGSRSACGRGSSTRS